MMIISTFSTKTNTLYEKQTFFKFFHTFKLPLIRSLSDLSNCLLREGKTCFHSTNNVLLLFSKDRSFEGIIVGKCFIFYFVLHFYD